MKTRTTLAATAIVLAAVSVLLSPPLQARMPARLQVPGQSLFGVPDPQPGPGNAHRIIAWAAYEKLVTFSDAQLDAWKSRGVDGFVIQTRYLDEIGGIEMWTGDPNDPLTRIEEGQEVHVRQRTLRDNRLVERCHARGLSIYLGFYLTNYHNLSTPLKVWNDDAGWNQIVPIVRGAAGAAKLLGMDGIATDSENYRSDSQTWNWDYPGVTQPEATVRELARQRGREFMTAVREAFPNVEIINYRIEIPGDWEERVQQQVNRVVGVWDKSVFPDFWGGIAETGGFRAIRFLDPIFYKSWHIGSGWDAALDYNVKGVRATLARRWSNWDDVSARVFLSPFAWIDPGPSAGSFDDARPPDYVARQLEAFHKWGEGNTFGLYTQHIDDFDYEPYVPALQAASTPDPAQISAPADIEPEAMSERDQRRRTERPTALEAPASTLSLRLQRVAVGISDPTDAAFAPDGRLFIAERAGRIRILRNGRLPIDSATMLDEVSTAGGNGLLAIAIDPGFARTHFVYVIYTAASPSGEPAFRLARFRENGGSLSERAIVLDAIAAAPAQAAAALRFGPDGKLYAAFDSGGDLRRMEDLGSYNGKVLRLDTDGRTPADHAAATPVYAYGYGVPRGLAWQPGSRGLWVAGSDQSETGRLRVVAGNEVGKSVRIEETSYRLPPVTAASAIAVYRGDLMPSLAGDLLIAIATSIVRVRLNREDPARIAWTETLVADAGGAVRALAVSLDGAIYFCVNDAVMRGVPGEGR